MAPVTTDSARKNNNRKEEEEEDGLDASQTHKEREELKRNVPGLRLLRMFHVQQETHKSAKE